MQTRSTPRRSSARSQRHAADSDAGSVNRERSVWTRSTMYLWADEFLKAGEELDSLLSLRADEDAGDRSAVLTLRPAAIALLNRFRAAVDDELAMNPALPRDLDKQLFAYLDQLEDMRIAAIASEKGAAPVDEPAPQPGGGAPPVP